MIADVMAYCHNYFDAEPDSGTFSIDGGVIDYAGVCSYIRISGSTYNDGVWHYADGVLTDDNGNAPTDEVFDGEIAQLAPPP